MEVGQVGVDGLLVLNPVELALKNVLEVVHDHLQDMTGNLAKEQRGKNKCATGKPALVRTKTL